MNPLCKIFIEKKQKQKKKSARNYFKPQIQNAVEEYAYAYITINSIE